MTKKKTSKGKCCLNLGLLVSPKVLENSYRQWLSKKNTDPIILSEHEKQFDRDPNQAIYQDIWLIYPMLEFLYSDFIHPDGEKEVSSMVYHYRCRHHDPKTGKCLIYAIRPWMCMSFPNYGPCNYKGCSCAGDGRKEAKKKEKHLKKLQKENKDHKICDKKDHKICDKIELK